MGKIAVVLVALLAACKSTPPSGSSSAPSEVIQPPAALSATQAAASAPGVYGLEELATLGFNARRLDTGDTLLCGSQCVCLKSLDCSEGGCISFEENVAAFRAALKAPGRGRSVSCRRAETGRCGEFRYFDFEGDLHRRELRWFDESGALVAQRNVSDYDAYCEGQTQALFVGSVPRCEVLSERERICGDGERPALTALEDLTRFMAAPARRQ